MALGIEGGKGSWMFRNGFFFWKLGMSDKIKFRKDKWVGTEPLSVSFPRLFNLASNRNATIIETEPYSNGSWIWKNI